MNVESGTERDSEDSRPARREGGLRSIGTDIAYTVGSQGIVALTQFLQYRMVRTFWGVEALSEYTLSYRVRSAIEWIVVVVLPLALARSMSAANTAVDRGRLATSGILCGLALVAIFDVVALSAPSWSARALFGSVEQARWLPPFCSILTAYVTYMLSAGILRGVFDFRAANVINVAAIAIAPTICLLLARGFALESVVVAMGVASTVVTVAGTLIALRRASSRLIDWRAARGRPDARATAELFLFGGPRVVSLVLYAVFAVVLPWMLSRDGHAEALASVNVLLALLGAAALLTSPVGFVLLPHFSKAFAVGDHARAVHQLRQVISATVFVGVIASGFALALTAPLLDFLVGGDGAARGILTLALAGAMPLFLVVDVLRSPLDAISRLPLNALNYLSGAAGILVVYLWPWFPTSMPLLDRCAYAIIAGYLFAAASALACASRRARSALLARSDVLLAAGWAVVMTCYAVSARAASAGSAVSLAFAAALLAGAAAYLAIFRPPWFRAIVAEWLPAR